MRPITKIFLLLFICWSTIAIAQPRNKAAFYDDKEPPSPPSATSNLMNKYEFYAKIQDALKVRPQWKVAERSGNFVLIYKQLVSQVPTPDPYITDSLPGLAASRAQQKYPPKPYEIILKLVPSTTVEYVSFKPTSNNYSMQQQERLDALHKQYNIDNIYQDKNTYTYMTFTTEERSRLAKYLLAREYIKKIKSDIASKQGPIVNNDYFIIDYKVQIKYPEDLYRAFPSTVTGDANTIINDIKTVLSNQ